MIERAKVFYGSEADDFIEYDYDDESAFPLTTGDMIRLDRDLEQMSVTEEEFDAWLNERDEVDPEFPFSL